MRNYAALGVLVGCVLALSSCAHEEKRSPFTGWYKNYSGCREDYVAMDARVEAAGVRDGAYYAVPGFPYLRTDRLLATFRNEVKGLNDVSEWTRRMRELDQEARDFEYVNLGMNEFDRAVQRDRFLNCGRILATIEFEDPAIWKKMVDAVPPPDEYSSLARTLGLYPFAAPGMKSRVARAHESALQEYGAAENSAAENRARDTANATRLWTVKAVEDMSLIAEVGTRVDINVLGFPALYGSQWRALAERHAPQLLIQTTGENDFPATPRFDNAGVTADASKPVVHYQIGYARFGGDNLVQISYFLWFKSAPDAGTGPIDGVIWRVTLDNGMQPLMFESLHASGGDHRWYPVQPLEQRSKTEWSDEPEFVAPELANARARLRLGAGESSHEIRRVLPAATAGVEASTEYELHVYEELYTLQRPEGGTRSLFGPDGIVPGSYGVDPIGGLASGIARPGALRQYGRHAISHVGRRHFDDPYLLESSFVAPPKPAGEVADRSR